MNGRCTNAKKTPAAFLRSSRPGRVTLEILLPIEAQRGFFAFHDRKGVGRGAGAALLPLDTKKLAAWLNGLPGCDGKDEGELELHRESGLLRFRGETVSDLTKREFDLLSYLVVNGPRIVSRREILSLAWRTVAVVNLVDTHIYNLRRKLPKELAARLQSVPGSGFRYFLREKRRAESLGAGAAGLSA